MNISSIYIRNFRRLFKCHIDLSKETTLFVGANNSGKTSAMDALGKFLGGRGFDFNDINIANRSIINAIGTEWTNPACALPEDLSSWETVSPSMDLWLDVSSNEIHYVAHIIPTLKWRGGKLGIRLAFLPKDLAKLSADYREQYFAARATESAQPAESTESVEPVSPQDFADSAELASNTVISLYPKDLCHFLERRLNTYFCLRSYILDPAELGSDPPQETSFDMECFTDNPLKGIINVKMINAQRGFTDPGASGEDEGRRTQLSIQMRNYYDKHLDPEKDPTPEDLEILKATEMAKSVFNKNLAQKFAPAIQELEGLGYPGVTDPKITITTKVTTSETLRHESAVQYSLSKKDDNLKLPEKYSGLGYQNLISIVFDLMGFRDEWMRQGKAWKTQEHTDGAIEPLHLVLVEEPEAHLHMQVQQVFIRKAYSILRNHDFLRDNPNFATQLVISTHSSHIVRESKFSNLRYFKRLPESSQCCVATAEVINLSDVFGKEDETNKFVTRYLQSTHCDLFFADAAILVEGSAESMLLPHFIRSKFPKLYQRYLSILSINGRHSHRLSPLIEKLCLPTLVIADLDPAEKDGHNKSVRPERGKNFISGNYAVTKWLIKKNALDELLDLKTEKKEFPHKTPYSYSIRIAYQTPITVDYEGTPVEALSSTFEDCLVYSNFELFKNLNSSDADGLVKKVNDAIAEKSTFNDLHEKIYEILKKGKSNQKAEFALDIIYDIDPKNINIPKYIEEGLEWLETLLCPKGECDD